MRIENRDHSGRTFVLLLLSILVELLGSSAPCAAQTSGATKTFEGMYFSFAYPSNWTLSQNSSTDVAVKAPGSATLFYEVNYLTAYGGNAAQALAAARTQLSQFASQNHATISFDDPEPSLLGGSAIFAYMSGGSTGNLSAWYDAVVVGKAVVLLSMTAPQQDFYSDLTTYRASITASLKFGNGASGTSFTLLGQWDSLLTKTSVHGRVYSVSLVFNSDGTYLYSVVQSEAPAWTIKVAGKYTTGTAPQNLEQASLALNLMPQTVNESGLSGLIDVIEIGLLEAQGFPGTTSQSFYLSWDLSGNLDLQAIGSGVVSEYKSAPVSITPPAPPSSPLAVFNAATFHAGPVAPGSCISIFGTFKISEASATKVPLPSSLSGVSVQINGRTAPLLYAGPTQINAQVPFGSINGTNTLTVYLNNVQQSSTTFTVVATAPGLFVDSAGHAVATNQDYSLNSSLRQAAGGSYLSVYFTGQGPIAPPVADGAAGSASPLAHTAALTTALIGGHPANVAFSGLAPGFVGVAQANVQVPPGLAAGDYSLVISVGGVPSNSAKVSVKP